MRGTISLERPLAGERKRNLSCELRRRPEAPGSSGSSGSSARAVTLSLALSATNSATCSLSFAAPHWLHNHSSLPLQLHDARAHGAVLVSAPYARAAQLFSLANDHGTARLGLLEPAAPHLVRVRVRVRVNRLTLTLTLNLTLTLTLTARAAEGGGGGGQAGEPGPPLAALLGRGRGQLLLDRAARRRRQRRRGVHR